MLNLNFLLFKLTYFYQERVLLKNISISLPELYIELLDKLGKEKKVSRSLLLREAIEERINADLSLKNVIHEAYPDLEYEMTKNRVEHFLKSCIACDKKLNKAKAMGQQITKDNDNIIELLFCNSCYKEYRDINIDKLPESIRNKIENYLIDSKKLGLF